MPPKELAIARIEHVRSRRRRSQRITETIHSSALEIDACKQRCGDTALALAQQLPSLFGILDVPREQDNARRLQPGEQGTEPQRHPCAVEANNQKLPDRFVRTRVAFVWLSRNRFLRVRLCPLR